MTQFGILYGSKYQWDNHPYDKLNHNYIVESYFRMYQSNNYQLELNAKSINNNSYPIQLCSKNSLEMDIKYIKHKIIEKGTCKIDNDDINAEFIKHFQKKFKENYKTWETHMNNIFERVRELDKLYISEDYFGLRKILLKYIINISLSLIIIGNDIKIMSQVNNCHDNKITISDQIHIFLMKLLPSMEKISDNHKETSKLNEEHSRYLRKNDMLVSRIQLLKRIIRIEEKKLDNGVPDMEKLNNSKMLLEDALSEQYNLNKKINKLITIKRGFHEARKQELHSLLNILQFNYFIHEDWFPFLDQDMITEY